VPASQRKHSNHYRKAEKQELTEDKNGLGVQVVSQVVWPHCPPSRFWTTLVKTLPLQRFSAAFIVAVVVGPSAQPTVVAPGGQSLPFSALHVRLITGFFSITNSVQNHHVAPAMNSTEAHIASAVPIIASSRTGRRSRCALLERPEPLTPIVSLDC
jgi:hypothetical protein